VTARNPTAPGGDTFGPGDDPRPLLAFVLSGAVILGLIGAVLVYARRGGAAGASALAPVGVTFVLFALVLVFRAYKNSFVMTLQPDAIAWRDWFSNERVLVADVAGCEIRWWADRAPRIRIVFVLRNGTEHQTQPLIEDQFPTLAAELRRRYAFPISDDSPRDAR
jgi:hypothetical protein